MTQIKMIRKILFITLCLTLLSSFSYAKNSKGETVIPAFNNILQKADHIGSILIFDPLEKHSYSNDFLHADSAFIPASTYKIPHSIIALELNIVASESTLFKWSGETFSITNWNQDLTFKEAFAFSCVPCYKKIALKIGAKRMKLMLDKLNYPGMVFTEQDIDQFWLQGHSKISQREQIDFMERFVQKQLPISARTQHIVENILINEENKNYVLRAKTGLSANGWGWFVGYITVGKQIWYFATHIKAKAEFNPLNRKRVTLEALKYLKIMK